MISNFYTILGLSEYLKSNIKDFFIREIYSQEKNKFLMELSKSEEENTLLEFSAEKGNVYLVLKNSFSKAKKNYAVIFTEVYGLKILEADIYNNDRAIRLVLENNYEFIFTFFANKSNCFLLKEKEVVNSFKDKAEHTGKFIREIIPQIAVTPEEDLSNMNVKEYIKKYHRKFGDLYVNEILFRTKLNNSDIVNENIIAKLKKEFKEIDKSLEVPEYILYRKDDLFKISLINLDHLNEWEKDKFENVNSLIAEYLKLKFRTEKISGYKSAKENELNSKLKALNRKIDGINIQLKHCTDSDQLRKTGDIILQNSYQISKGQKVFTFTEESGNNIEIKLKENLSAVENAQFYFDKYKKQKSSAGLLKTKIENLEKDKLKLMKEFEQLKEVSDIKKINKEEKKAVENKNDETSRFRKFILNDKYEVWVGKDSASNDLLTTKYSAQNDLWFHVRGASGSHTVLKISNRKETAPKEIIQAAASVAAYYSKARNSSTVPVAFCERKYVKKKKGFKQGSVIMEREKVIFVKPLLPEISS